MFKRGLTPSQQLVNAAIARDLEALNAQLVAGADPNACDRAGFPAVAIAASRGWAEGVAALVRAGADPSQHVQRSEPQAFSGPLLHLPSANGSLETARVLLDAGAAVDATDPTGLTALMCAAFQGHEPIIRLLIDAGASLETRDQEGYTALMFAANAGRASAVRTLLEVGADPHARAKDDSTPLMFAAQHAHNDVVVMLLDAGADASVVGRHGLSAIGFARQNRHERTLSLLLAAGGAGS